MKLRYSVCILIHCAETFIAAVGWHAFDAAVATHSLDFVKAVGQVSRIQEAQKIFSTLSRSDADGKYFGHHVFRPQ